MIISKKWQYKNQNSLSFMMPSQANSKSTNSVNWISKEITISGNLLVLNIFCVLKSQTLMRITHSPVMTDST